METINTLTENDEAIAEEALDRLNTSDIEYWTAIAGNPNISEEYKKTVELLLINLKVAAIAGWTDIEEWNPDPKDRKPVKVYQGTNLAHPELGKFIPNYVGNIDAIALVFKHLDTPWSLANHGGFASADAIEKDQHSEDGLSFSGDSHGVGKSETPAIALCKLLLAINPKPIKPAPKPDRAWLEETGEITPEIIEASFG